MKIRRLALEGDVFTVGEPLPEGYRTTHEVEVEGKPQALPCPLRVTDIYVRHAIVYDAVDAEGKVQAIETHDISCAFVYAFPKDGVVHPWSKGLPLKGGGRSPGQAICLELFNVAAPVGWLERVGTYDELEALRDEQRAAEPKPGGAKSESK